MVASWLRRWAPAILATAVLATALAIGATRLFGPSRTDSELRRLEAELGKTRSEVAELRRRESRIIYVDGQRPPPAPTDPAQLGATTGTESPGPDSPTRDDPALVARRKAKFAAALDRRIAEEGFDPEWSAGALAGIRSAVVEHATGSWLLDAKCGMTLCRAVVAHGSHAEQKAIGESLANLPPFDEGTYYHRDTSTDGPLRTTLYVVRDGYGVEDAAEEARSP